MRTDLKNTMKLLAALPALSLAMSAPIWASGPGQAEFLDAVQGLTEHRLRLESEHSEQVVNDWIEKGAFFFEFPDSQFVMVLPIKANTSLEFGMRSEIAPPFTVGAQDDLDVSPLYPDASVDIFPSDDTWIQSGNYINQNFNGALAVRIGREPNPNGNSYTLIKAPSFSLSGVYVSDASLSLYAYSCQGTSFGRIEVHEILGPWNVGTVTWGSQPTIRAATDYISDPWSSCPGPGYVNLRVRDSVRNWVSGQTANNGVMVNPDLLTTQGGTWPLGSSVDFRAAEFSGTTYDPLLTVYYTPCTYSISPPSNSFPSSGGPGSFTVTTQSGCAWSATESLSWVTITSGSSGTGSGTVSYNVTSNGGGARNGPITVNGQTHTVYQDEVVDCTAISLTPTSNSFPSDGGPGSFDVSIAAGCSWSASESLTWATITSGASGTGPGTVYYNVSSNTGAARNGPISVNGQTHTVYQDAYVNCNSITLTPTSNSFPSSGGPGSFQVSIGSGCSWSASESLTWVTITSGASGTGPGTVYYNVSSNTGAARNGPISVNGQTHSVSQAGQSQNCTLQVLSPNGGETWTIGSTVSASWASSGTGCPPLVRLELYKSGVLAGYWQNSYPATSSISFLLTAGLVPGNDYRFRMSDWNNSQFYDESNSNFSISDGACSYSISPSSQNFGAGGGAGSFTVTAPTGCTWSASSNQSWASITSGGSGNGNGTVNYSVAANGTTSTRTAAITAGGQTHSISQPGQSQNCTLQVLSPNGGENWITGSEVFPSWTSSGTGCPPQVRVEFYKGGISWAVFNSTFPSTYSISYIVETHLGTGNNFRLRVSDPNNNQLYDESNSNFSISNTPCNYSISPTSASVPSSASSETIAVTSPTGCGWSAFSNVGWITVTGGASGSGNGTVSYNIAQNSSSSTRTGTMSIAGLTFTVSQSPAGNSCNYSISPTSRSLGAQGGQSSFAVTTTSSCSWAATTSTNWIHITGGSTGTGSGTVNYYADSNPSNARSGSIVAGGRTHTVYQGGSGNSNCTADSQTLCLYGGRFEVKATYTDYSNNTGSGWAVALTPDSGYFWFFDSSNVEAVGKIVNFCGVNGSFGYYAGGLTDVGVVMTVRDTVANQTQTFTNPRGHRFDMISSAFNTCQSGNALGESETAALDNEGIANLVLGGDLDSISATSSAPPHAFEIETLIQDAIAAATPWQAGLESASTVLSTATSGNGLESEYDLREADASSDAMEGGRTPCFTSSTTLCLYGGRFEVEATYTDYSNNTGSGQAVALTSDSGYFWFFDSSNVEAVGKIVSFCGVNGSFGYYAGGLTDVGVVMTVRDTVANQTQTFTNARGHRFNMISSAFNTCQ